MNDKRITIRLSDTEISSLGMDKDSVTSSDIKSQLMNRSKELDKENIIDWLSNYLSEYRVVEQNEVKQLLGFLKECVNYNILDELPGDTIPEKVKGLSGNKVKEGFISVIGGRSVSTHQYAGHVFINGGVDSEGYSGVILRNKFGKDVTIAEEQDPEGYRLFYDYDENEFRYKPGDIIV